MVTAADRAAATCQLPPTSDKSPRVHKHGPTRTSAAALSAAVDSTYKQETAPNSHGREPPKEQPSLFPATLREGARGRRFS